MNNDRLVSVIIPTFKGSINLTRAIDSVLNQTYKNIELIIVDDNNPYDEEREKTSKIIESYNDKRIKYVKHSTNKNGAVARNTGIKISQGRYLTFLDDDDFLFPNRIEKTVNYLEKNSNYGAVYTDVVLVNKNTIIGSICADKILNYKDILLNENIVGTGSNIFLDKKKFNKELLFDENFIRHQDLEFMIRICKQTKILNLNKKLIVKATNNTNNLPNYKKLKITKEQYISKFKTEINSMDDKEVEQFLYNNYRRLYISALLTNNKYYVLEAIDNMKKYGKVLIIDKVCYYMVFLGLFNTVMSIYRKLKVVISKFYHKKSYLTEQEIKFIKERI